MCACDQHVIVPFLPLPLYRPPPPLPVPWWRLVVQQLPNPQTQVLLVALQTLEFAELKSNKVKLHVNGFY